MDRYWKSYNYLERAREHKELSRILRVIDRNIREQPRDADWIMWGEHIAVKGRNFLFCEIQELEETLKTPQRRTAC